MDSNSAAQVSTSLKTGSDPVCFAQFPHLLNAGVAFQLPLRCNALVAEPEPLQAAQVRLS
jgi:hypothetical protein